MKSLIFLTLIVTSVSLAQQTDKFFTLKYAKFDYFNVFSQNSSFPYYELGFGKFLYKDKLALSIYYAFWKDDVNENIGVDGPTYSYGSRIVGMRGVFLIKSVLPHFLLPIQIYAGMNYHFLKVRYVGGSDMFGTAFKSYGRQKTMFEYGLSLPITIYKNFGAVLEYQKYLSFGSSPTEFVNYNNKEILKAGLALGF